MKPTDDVEELVRQLRHRASPEFRGAAREKMLTELEAAGAPKPQSLWRIIMTSKKTRYAVAASILIALAVVLFRFGSPIDSSAVLAQAVKKTEGIDTLIHQERRIFCRKGESEPSLLGNAVKYGSPELGSVEKHFDANGELVYAAYFLKKEKRIVVVFPAFKGYLDLPLNDDLAALSDDLSPKGLVRLLTRQGYVDLGRVELDGRDAVGFEMSRESIWDVVSRFRQGFFLVPVTSASARLWIDVETSLPVRVEAELEVGRGLLTGFQEGTAHLTAYDFQWGAELDPSLFVPEIPPDYERIDVESIPQQAATSAGLLTLPLVAFFALKRRRRRRT